MNQPSHSTFWRFIFGTVFILALFAYWDLVSLSQQLNIAVLSSKPWTALLISLTIFTFFVLSLLVISYSRVENRLIEFLEPPVTNNRFQRWLGWTLLLIGLTGFVFTTSIPYFIRIFGMENGVRYLIFLLFSLTGMLGIRMIRNEIPWLTALIVMILCQTVIQLFLAYFSGVTSYPFAMGWSETSRFYFPSLFLSEKVYGEKFPWPILHPTLHLLLAPPYLFEAPLWFHRLWQVLLRYLLVGLIIPPLLARLSIKDHLFRRLVALWMLIFLFMGPIYFHLAVPVIIVLLGFSPKDERRTWAAVILASLWCGWSRVNWYPVPGMIAAVLYLLEVPIDGRRVWRYLLRPALWFVTGTMVAFVAQRIYIYLSGVNEGGSFYTSLSSDLLWYRLLPNATYSPGILPAALLASLPMWLEIYLVIRSNNPGVWHPVRLTLLFGALLVLFVGGLVVSLKIGGGMDLHNMDAYFILLLIVFSYLVFARYRAENGKLNQTVSMPWFLVLAVIIVPAWWSLRFNIGFKTYDANRTQMVLESLQDQVNDVNARGGEILFITQRQLISMHILKGVTLIPEYEREDLMEMAMGNNTEYLGKFRTDMENQRFDLIVVDPLNFNIMTKNRSFAEENNVWVRRVMRHILCNYREDTIFAEDEIALYVPQEGERQCPQR